MPKPPPDAFDWLCQHPLLAHWTHTHDRVLAPDHSFDMDRVMFEQRGAVGVYASLAHRRTRMLLSESPNSHITTALQTLSEQPDVRHMLIRLEALTDTFRQVADVHDMALTQWDFCNPAVRIRAIAPDATTILEGIIQPGHTTQLFVYRSPNAPNDPLHAPERHITTLTDSQITPQVLKNLL